MSEFTGRAAGCIAGVALGDPRNITAERQPDMAVAFDVLHGAANRIENAVEELAVKTNTLRPQRPAVTVPDPEKVSEKERPLVPLAETFRSEAVRIHRAVDEFQRLTRELAL